MASSTLLCDGQSSSASILSAKNRGQIPFHWPHGNHPYKMDVQGNLIAVLLSCSLKLTE